MLSMATVASLRVVVPLASLGSESITVHFDQVLVTLRPRPTLHDHPGLDSAAAIPDPQPPPRPSHLAAAPMVGISETIKLVAGGLEALLQRMRFVATQVVVQVEGWQEDSTLVAVLQLDSIECSGSALEMISETELRHADVPAAARMSKAVTFSGLAFGFAHTTSAPINLSSLLTGLGAGGCSGNVELTYGWSMGSVKKRSLTAAVELGPILLDVDEAKMASTAALVRALKPPAASLGHVGNFFSEEAPGPAPEPFVWSGDSLFEDLMLPDCESVVTEVVEGSIYEDASSEFGGNEASATLAASIHEGALLHDLTASLRQVWKTLRSCRCQLPSLASKSATQLFGCCCRLTSRMSRQIPL
jgi:hypothetical protein